MIQMILPILAAFISGGGIFTFIIFLINRKDDKSNKLDTIIKKQTEMELGILRLQLLNLVQHEGSQHELMMVAEKYFKDMGGDWYMSPIFCEWLKKHGYDKPVWFKSEE